MNFFLDEMVSLASGQIISGRYETQRLVLIGDKKLTFDFLSFGDNYDPKWISKILSDRRFNELEFYIQNPNNRLKSE